MPFVDCPQCKICKSTIRPKIDRMLNIGTPYKKIVDFAKENGLDIRIHNISKHSIKHRALTKAEIEHAKKTNAARRNFNKNKLVIVSASQCLDDIINRAYTSMQNGNLKPTIDHALKAIELQAKLKESGILESKLIDFMFELTGQLPLPSHIQKANAPTSSISQQPINSIASESPEERITEPIPDKLLIPQTTTQDTISPQALTTAEAQ